MNSRDGLIDITVRTSESGYLCRKLIKGMEDVKVCYDGTVRSGNNIIIQMIYSGNNIHLGYCRNVKLNIITLNYD